MFPTLSLDDAQAEQWDVVIAGSSFAAMFFLRGLPSDLRVLIVEKGRVIDWDAQVRGKDRPKEDYRIDNTSEHQKEFTAHTLFGGNSNCWWGQAPRMHPSDFGLFSRYGVGEDWPLDYETLEPFYTEVEDVMQIAGGGNEAHLPRSAPFPFPAHTPSRSDVALQDARPDIWVPVPTGRANGGRRATCCATGVCSTCPIDAKFTILNSIDQFTRPNVMLLPEVDVRRVSVQGGKAAGIEVLSGGQVAEIAADTVALATNAINNAAILLRSGLGGPVAGQFLHEQTSIKVVLDVKQKNYFGGSAITGHGYGAYDGPHRSEVGGVLIENFNAPNRLRTEKDRWTERLSIRLIAEDLPLPGNRVVLDDAGVPVVKWIGHSDYGTKGLERALAILPELIPFEIEATEVEHRASTEAHIQGTHRMGLDPATSVTDDGQRVHGVENLLALGSGGFPSCSPANPTLTLSALALRAGRLL